MSHRDHKAPTSDCPSIRSRCVERIFVLIGAPLTCVLLAGSALAQSGPGDMRGIDGPGISSSGIPRQPKPLVRTAELERVLKMDTEYQRARGGLVAFGALTSAGVLVGAMLMATTGDGPCSTKGGRLEQGIWGGITVGVSLLAGLPTMAYFGTKMHRIARERAALQAAMLDVDRDRVGVRLSWQF